MEGVKCRTLDHMQASMFNERALGELIPLHGEVQTRYGLLPYNTVAFRPNRLDEYPAPSVAMMGAVSRATAALHRLDTIGNDIADPELLWRPTIRREAQSTSALEGMYERLETVLAVDYEIGDSKRGFNTSMREVLNYIDATDHGTRSIQDGRPLGLHLTRELQQVLVQGTLSDNAQAGEIRSTQVFIGAPTGRIEDARFVPMPPGDPLAAELEALFSWWDSRADPGLVVLDAAMFHYQFETLHPFTDGNGRIGRLLILLQCMSRNMLRQPLLSVSPWFERRRTEYQDRLLQVSTHGDWEQWILFFCQGIEESSYDTYDRIQALNVIRERYRKLALNYGPVTRGLVDILIGSPYMTTPLAVRRLHVTRSAAANAIRNLEEAGILREIGRLSNHAVQYVADEVARVVQ